jgi:hypothetical protein
VEGLRLDVNADALSVSSDPFTVDQLIEHYRQTELTDANAKTMRTKDVC